MAMLVTGIGAEEELLVEDEQVNEELQEFLIEAAHLTHLLQAIFMLLF